MNDHDADIGALVDRLLALEYERGQLRAQLDFHLRLRALAASAPAPAPEPAPVIAWPRGKAADEARWRPGALEAAVLAQLEATPGQTPRQVAVHVDAGYQSVRQILMRLARQGLVRREAEGYVRVQEALCG